VDFLMCFGSKPKNNAAKDAERAEAARQARISTGMSAISNAFAPFNDDFYSQRAQDYIDYAEPQLDDQYADAKKALVYALSRTGNLASTTAAQRQAKLKKQYDTNRLAVRSQGDQYANQARSDVENARGDLVSQLQASADPDAATNLAYSQAKALTGAPAYSPLGQVFADVTSGIGPVLNSPATGYQGLLRLFNTPKNKAATVVA
jgi:hypothetical protein